MTHGSLFSGIGGFDLAAEWMGWENIFHCEWMPFPRQILSYHFPKSISYHDITKTDFTIHRGQIDILTGGFPCQPYSLAGKRKGKEDERHLWPEMLRAIKEIQPRWVVGENVYGLVNWSGGLVFHEVQTDLEAAGYEVFPYVLPACSVNAPHRRDRVWFVAYCNGSTTRPSGKSRSIESNWGENDAQQSKWGSETELNNRPFTFLRNAPDTNGNGQQRSDCEHEINTGEGGEYALGNTQQNDITNSEGFGQKQTLENKELERRRFRLTNQRNAWDTFPSQSPICTGDDGISDRLDGITFSKWRNESIKGAGNAIVPQVAFQIFKAIEQYELLINKNQNNVKN